MYHEVCSANETVALRCTLLSYTAPPLPHSQPQFALEIHNFSYVARKLISFGSLHLTEAVKQKLSLFATLHEKFIVGIPSGLD